MDSNTRHLLRLEAVRERANIVFRLAEQGKLHHYDYHPERLDATVDYVAGIIQVNSLLYIQKPSLTIYSARLRPGPLRPDPSPRSLAALRRRRRASNSETDRAMGCIRI